MPLLTPDYLHLTEARRPEPQVIPPAIDPDRPRQLCLCRCRCGCGCAGSPGGPVQNPDAGLCRSLSNNSPRGEESSLSNSSSFYENAESVHKFMVEVSDLGWNDLNAIQRMLDRRAGFMGMLPSDYGVPASPFISPTRSGILSPISLSVEASSAESSGQRSLESSISQLSPLPPSSPLLAGVGSGAGDPQQPRLLQFIILPNTQIGPDHGRSMSRPSRPARNAQEFKDFSEFDFW